MTEQREAPKPFQTLEFPATLWLDAEALQERWHHLSAQAQAQKMAPTDVEQLNAAYAQLASPAERLKLLIRHRFPDVNLRTADVPQPLIDQFMEIGGFLQKANDYLRKRENAKGHLAQALLAPEGQALRKDLEQLRAKVTAALKTQDERLRTLSPHWSKRAEEILEDVSQLYQGYAFLTKWQRQLSSMGVELME